MVATSTIGHWRRVVGVIVRLSPVTAALLLGFTTNFAPRMVYQLVYKGRVEGGGAGVIGSGGASGVDGEGGRGGGISGGSSRSSFVRFSLSAWRVRDFGPEARPNLHDEAIRNSTLHVKAFARRMNLSEDVCFYQVVGCCRLRRGGGSFL